MNTTSFGIRKFVMALAIAAAAAGTMAGPALAADWDHHREPVRHDEHHWRVPPHRVFYAPAPVFERVAPAPVYVPPRVAYAPAASFSVTIPFNFQ